MPELKTQQNAADVDAFLSQVAHEKRRTDAQKVCALIKDITGWKPMMWGNSIVGFGAYEGKTGRWMITGLSPRKASLSVYIMPGFEKYSALMEKLGKHKTGRSCLYINKLEDIDLDILAEIIRRSVADMQDAYTCQPQ